MSRRGAGFGLLLLALAALVWLSARLAVTRIYQVDECQNLYMARVLATGQAREFFTNGSLFLLGPLAWISRTCVRTEAIFGTARVLFLGVFWLNMVLLARIGSPRSGLFGGLIALIAAATLAPLWDYGFEVRHDNLILTGILLMWFLVRTKPMGLRSYALAGAVSVALLFVAVKSVVYVVPFALAVLAFPPSAHQRSRWQLLLAWVGGALLATAAIRIGYGAGGGWDIYLAVFRGVTQYSTGGGGGSEATKFWPWATLGRLLWQTPLLLALALAACFALAADLWRRGRAALTWEGFLPEGLLLAGALGGLLANPTPFPYNLVHVVPYAFILAFTYSARLWTGMRDSKALWPFVGSVLIFLHLVPFGFAVRNHLNHPNSRQTCLMRLAEDLTDPVKDPVYDGIGMVLTRPSIHYQWYLHSLNIHAFRTQPGLRVHEMLAARPAAVFIPSYRTDWLLDSDHEFIREHYVPVADDFWVLGKVLPAGGGTFQIFHPGRYRISSLQGSDIADERSRGSRPLPAASNDAGFTATLDGVPVPSGPVELTVGSHRLECKVGCAPAVVWVGPKRDRVGPLSQGDHRLLFVNWY